MSCLNFLTADGIDADNLSNKCLGAGSSHEVLCTLAIAQARGAGVSRHFQNCKLVGSSRLDRRQRHGWVVQVGAKTHTHTHTNNNNTCCCIMKTVQHAFQLKNLCVLLVDSYRASKTALNQYTRTASIELNRSSRGRPVCCVALHPGK